MGVSDLQFDTNAGKWFSSCFGETMVVQLCLTVAVASIFIS